MNRLKPLEHCKWQRGLKLISKFALLAGISATTMNAAAALNWPSNQVLPSFPQAAPTQDLFLLHGKSKRWQAESELAHATGRNDGDGWLCQTGIDAPNMYMVYGPYNDAIPAGGNTARFSIKIDNNTAVNDAQVTLDVRNATTGEMLAEKTVNRHDFNTAGVYQTFNLPFNLPVGGQKIELRVYWHGRSYIKVDWVEVAQGPGTTEQYLFASLKGLVNVNQPRLFSYEGDAFAEGKYAWLNSLGLNYVEHADNWALIEKYRSEINGLIVYDPAVPDTINLATTLAGRYRALVTAPHLIERLQAPPYNLPVVEDFRGRFTGKLDVYETLFNQYWPSLTHRAVVGINPNAHRASVREYAVAMEAATLWLDPEKPAQSELLNKFLRAMPSGANFLGWWPAEEAGVRRASEFNIPTIASDWSTNLSLHSGMPRVINAKPIPNKPNLQNKVYVAFILSDGDNLQYVEHLMRKLWKSPDRGSVPMGWTVSPAMVDAMPGALNFYHETSTANDNLISGPSGYGYTYPNMWPSAQERNKFIQTSAYYNRAAGLDVVTIWNTITGGINAATGNAFARFAPQTLGLTGQNTGGGITIYDGSMPGMALSCNYCTNREAIENHIRSASAGWNGNGPRFVLIQAQPWQGVTPTTFKNVANGLNSDYKVVRPDHFFQLMRESRGLPWTNLGYPRKRLENKGHGLWLQTTHIEDGSGEGNNVQAVANSFTGDKTRWQLVPVAGDPEYFRIENEAFGMWLQCSDLPDASQGQPSAEGDAETLAVRAVPTSFQGDWTRWRKVDSGDGYFHLENKAHGTYLQVTPIADVDANGFDSGNQVRAVPAYKTGSWTRFREI